MSGASHQAESLHLATPGQEPTSNGAREIGHRARTGRGPGERRVAQAGQDPNLPTCSWPNLACGQETDLAPGGQTNLTPGAPADLTPGSSTESSGY